MHLSLDAAVDGRVPRLAMQRATETAVAAGATLPQPDIVAQVQSKDQQDRPAASDVKGSDRPARRDVTARAG